MTAVEVAPKIELRPYQVEALERIATAEARGVRKQLGVAATGLGKTIMFVALAMQRGGRALILVHRDELARQAYAKVRELWPGIDVGIVKAQDDDCYAHVVIASVQTLARATRLSKLVAVNAGEDSILLKPPGPFELVIVDEAHHTAAASYRTILEAFEAGTADGPLLLGVTATPDRGDGKGLDDLFDEITFNFDILWGIRSGFLSDVRALRVVVSDLDLSQVKVRNGDFEQGAVGRAMHQSHTGDAIWASWNEHARDRRTLIFTPTVAYAHEIAELFVSQGIAAAAIDAGTDRDERRRILAAYSAGEVQVLVNCAVLTEGYDEPRTDCIVQARPTKSRALFTQMVGRGTRKHPEKADLLVLDIVGSSEEHSLITVPSLFGFEKKLRKAMGDGTGLLSDVAQERDDQLVAAGKMRHEDADLFRKLRGLGVAWVQIHQGNEAKRYQRTLSTRDRNTNEFVPLPTVVLTQRHPRDDGWLCGLINPDGSKRVLLADVTLELAQGVGEDTVHKLLGSQTQLVNAGAEWRSKRPSRKARDAARKWRLPHLEQYKSAGELSDALDAHIARKREEQRRRSGNRSTAGNGVQGG